jgi:phthalate 4,5-dioxygenase
MREADNVRLTRIGPGTEGGQLLRRYWYPIALLDEFDRDLQVKLGTTAKDQWRPVKPIRLLGEDLLLWQDANSQFCLMQRHCPHRGADLAFGRWEGPGDSHWGDSGPGLRCPFHGWKFDSTGQCIETPGEPKGSRHCDRIKAQTYPLQIKAGVLWAFIGDGVPPPLPSLDCLTAPASHVFAFKGLWRCNWLQATEVGLDPAHTSFLHAFFEDESLEASYGRQFRNASAGDVDGERWPMTRVMREAYSPDIQFEARPWGQQITTLRHLNERSTHVRVTHGLFPNGFVIPLSETMTITQFHVPIDDTNTWWFSIFTSFDQPVNKETMRNQRLQANPAPHFAPNKTQANAWGYNPLEQRHQTMLGMGEADINVHDQWAVESMGAISDRTREHLGTTDKVIIAHRRALLKAIEAVKAGESAPGFANPAEVALCKGPDTIDGIAPAHDWQAWWQDQVESKRAKANWSRS